VVSAFAGAFEEQAHAPSSVARRPIEKRLTSRL
jgi:hypothetical protein